MKQYSEKEIITLLHNQGDINVIAVATTPWHALGVDAVLYSLQQRGVNLKGFIIIKPHQVTGIGLSAEHFAMRQAGDLEIISTNFKHSSVSTMEKIQKKFQKIKYYHTNSKDRQDEKKLYWIQPMSPAFDLLPLLDTTAYKYNIITILTDEGLGTYLNSILTWVKVSFHEGGWKQALRVAVNSYIIDRYCMKRLIKKKQLQYYQLLKYSEKKWIPNEEAIVSYRAILQMNKYEEDFSRYSNAVILNTGPYETIIKNNADLKVLQMICNLLQEQKIPIILKPHPREKNLTKYQILGCKIEKNYGIAQENIFATLAHNPYCLIGFDSTTLISAKLLFGIEAISINRLISQEELFEKGRDTAFNKVFGEIISIPENLQEFENIVKKMVIAENTYCLHYNTTI